jgi:hypothetical protein
MGSHGLIFTFLPAVLLVAGKAFSDLARLFRGAAVKVFAASLLAVVVVNVLAFAVAPDTLGGVHIVNRDTLVKNDLLYENRLDLLRENFRPAETLILTENWRHIQYYLPEYTVLSSPCTTSGSEDTGFSGSYLIHEGRYTELKPADLARVVSGVHTLVLFDGPQGCFFPPGWSATTCAWVRCCSPWSTTPSNSRPRAMFIFAPRRRTSPPTTV